MTETFLNIDICTMPGHFARRVHQLAVALFVQEVDDLNVTPIQCAALLTICNNPEIDQKTLASQIGIDTSTIAGVIDRLEVRGLVVRNVAPHDRRARQITPTESGVEIAEAVVPRLVRSQERLLESLSKADQREFMRLMKLLIDANTELSNVPAKD
ncbi:MarR family winged helix-turn-helix transcriptional regulator [Paraburkholderia bannensis]|uniref:MarR family winged helix-turn-helix transcriptional regulator n=1 Tax=Paraburkholderia bannensis TaxID=765414 RepID=UPI002AB0842F|nr:MarR family transcriptional regulator [Paraburkholderia bannensis]